MHIENAWEMFTPLTPSENSTDTQLTITQTNIETRKRPKHKPAKTKYEHKSMRSVNKAAVTNI